MFDERRRHVARTTQIDRAIQNIDEKIAQHRADIQALELARKHLVDQQQKAGAES